MEYQTQATTRELKVGSSVIYIDPYRKLHNALVTNVFGSPGPGLNQFCGCNLVFVVADESKVDPYGRQIERATSQVHLSNQPAKAGCWCWPDEVPAE